MQDPKSRILQYQRLRPQKKGKLPHFTKDFESYAQQIEQIIKNKVQFSFDLNKFGLQKNKFVSVKLKQKEESKSIDTVMNCSNISIPQHYGCDKYLRYNGTTINPNHKIKIRNRSQRKLQKNLSQPSFISIKPQANFSLPKIGYNLPKISLTSREKSGQKFSLLSKESLSDSKTVRVQNHQIQGSHKKQNYIRLYHIVTMGRKQINE